jgi:hypothetical protein
MSTGPAVFDRWLRRVELVDDVLEQARASGEACASVFWGGVMTKPVRLGMLLRRHRPWSWQLAAPRP